MKACNFSGIPNKMNLGQCRYFTWSFLLADISVGLLASFGLLNRQKDRVYRRTMGT
jgi:hypothetical protein